MTRENIKEELILKAAREVFIEKGRNGARMQEIADRAGINKALLHYYFRSKDNIYRKIIEQVFALFVGQIESTLKTSSSSEEILRGIINIFSDNLTENPQTHLFILQELSQGGGVAKEILARLIAEGKFGLPAAFVRTLGEEIAAGHIAKVDPRQLMLTVLGSCMYFFIAEPFFMAVFSPGPSFDRRRFIAERKEAIFNIIFYGIKPRGP